jgi:hypothetical protein
MHSYIACYLHGRNCNLMQWFVLFCRSPGICVQRCGDSAVVVSLQVNDKLDLERTQRKHSANAGSSITLSVQFAFSVAKILYIQFGWYRAESPAEVFTEAVESLFARLCRDGPWADLGVTPSHAVTVSFANALKQALGPHLAPYPLCGVFPLRVPCYRRAYIKKPEVLSSSEFEKQLWKVVTQNPTESSSELEMTQPSAL